MADWIIRLVEQGGYAGVALLMFLETVFPPIPSEVIMPLSGLAAHRGQLSLAGVIAAGTAGAMAGNYLWYLVARALGLDRFRPFIERHGRLLTIDWRAVEKADKLFDRHAGLFVCIGRVTPNLRSLVSIPAGLFGMAPLPFILWSTAGTAGWTAMLATAGYMLGTRYDVVEQWLAPVSTGIIVLMVAAYLWRVMTWKRH
jgi:membrane protein DedA with SNARE-associated domain